MPQLRKIPLKLITGVKRVDEFAGPDMNFFDLMSNSALLSNESHNF